MTRKKGKRARRERIPGAGEGSTAIAGRTEEGTASVSQETATSVETFPSEPPAAEPAPETELPNPIAFPAENGEAEQLSRPAEIAPSRVEDLEAELAEWKARAAAAAEARVASQPPPTEPVPAPVAADAERVADLHQQTMSRLTVILACADLLAMNPRLDASSRETAQAIREQGKLLGDIIKNFSLPPDSRKAE